MAIKKPSFTSPLPLGRVPRGIVPPNVGSTVVAPGRKATAGVIGQRMQPVPKGSGGNGNGNGGKSGNEKK